MSQRRFFERLDDWMNPIVVKELRQAVQSRLVVSALMLFLFIQIFILGTRLLSTQTEMQGGIDYRAGRTLFMFLEAIMLGTCMLVPAYVGGRLNTERSDTNSDLMFISTLKPRTIVAGKFLSGVILVLLIFSACTPFMTFTYLLRGIDIPTILLVVAMDFVLAMWGIAGVIFLAVIPAPRAVKGAMGMASFFGLWGLFALGMGFTEVMVNQGLFFGVGTWEFWRIVLLMLAIIVGQCALFFTWSTAILSPPSANKAVLVRLVMLGYVVLLGVPCYLVSAAINSYAPLAIWVIIASQLGCLQLFISVNEREHLGPRVKRTIPRSPLLRPLAFLFYSGSAGGVLFSSLLLLGTIGTGVLILHIGNDLENLGYTMYHPAFKSVWRGRGWDGAWEMLGFLRFSVLLALYTYCYCMTAVFVRRVLLGGRIKPNFTWLVTVLLVGLGTAAPYLIWYFLMQGRIPSSGNREYEYWLLTNPFDSIYFALDRYRNADNTIFGAPCMPFLVVWAALVSAVNIPWFVEQAKRFKPQREKTHPVLAPLHGRVDSEAIA